MTNAKIYKRGNNLDHYWEIPRFIVRSTLSLNIPAKDYILGPMTSGSGPMGPGMGPGGPNGPMPPGGPMGRGPPNSMGPMGPMGPRGIF